MKTLFVLLALATSCRYAADKTDTSDTGGIDADGDGYTVQQGDCDDENATVHPDLAELCDGIDNNCDGQVDEGATSTWFADEDGDGFGSSLVSQETCEQPKGYVDNDDDCDDGDPTVYPLAEEFCNDVDDDCDGEVDEEGNQDWYADVDGDGFGDESQTIQTCTPPKGYVDNGDDCDDDDASINPEASELCDRTDNDCDGSADEDALDASEWHADVDGDGYGDSDSSLFSCDAPKGHLTDGSDCDDMDAQINPEAAEICDNLDNDCDGSTDEDATDAPTWYYDSDGDGYGDPKNTFADCMAGPYGVENDEDCDDTDPQVNPDGEETCDNRDNDCDGSTDEDATDALTWYYDDDGDGYGDPDDSLVDCFGSPDVVENDEDCDDSNGFVSPDAVEFCDGIDNDCDEAVDEDDAQDASTWYQDSDGDSWGDPDSPVVTCYQRSDTVSNDGDCDDDDGTVNPDASEICGDGVDNDCDGGARDCAPLGELDLASAGFKLTGEDQGDGAGSTLAAAGDVNADGFDDLLVGAPQRQESTGQVYLLLGPVSADQDLGTASASFVGEQLGDEAGSGMAALGDIDGDGYGDLLLGASAYDGPGTDSGAAYLVLGPVTGSVSMADADARYTGAASEDGAGYALDNAGDVDGDGQPDLLIGAWGDDDTGSDAGAAYLLLGPATTSISLSAADAKLTGEAAEDWAAERVAGAGDVNGDGFDDIFAAARQQDSAGSNAGAAYLLLGPVTGSVGLSSADARLLGEAEDDEAGEALAAAGDVDADGYADLLVGSRNESSNGSQAGAAYLVLGPITGDLDLGQADAKLLGEQAGDQAGESLAGGGDLDADGHSDLLIGADDEGSAANAAGATYLLYGPISGTQDLGNAHAKLLGEAFADGSGAAVSIGGDVDADGSDDLLVGAPNESSDAIGAGAAYLVLGGSL